MTLALEALATQFHIQRLKTCGRVVGVFADCPLLRRARDAQAQLLVCEDFRDGFGEPGPIPYGNRDRAGEAHSAHRIFERNLCRMKIFTGSS